MNDFINVKIRTLALLLYKIYFSGYPLKIQDRRKLKRISRNLQHVKLDVYLEWCNDNYKFMEFKGMIWEKI